MDFILTYWNIILVVLVLAVLAGGLVWWFVKLPRSKQVDKVKQWLLWAVVEAERALGSGTGKLKLRCVYDLFVERFPAVARAVSFETFADWVDEALETVEGWLKERAIAEYTAQS